LRLFTLLLHRLACRRVWGAIVVRDRIKTGNGMPGATSEKEKQDQRRYAHLVNYRATGRITQLPSLLSAFRQREHGGD
jgi:hypothetical protein